MTKAGSERGNTALILVFLLFAFSLVILLLFDFSRIFIARSCTKKAANSAALAAAHEILYFNSENSKKAASDIAARNNCKLENIRITYDEVVVYVSKDLEFIFVKILGPDFITVYSVSKTEVVFPWDEKFNNCDRVKFDFN